MKVTIIIPYYEAHNYIGETLKSIAIQSHKDINVIIVNDGSSQESSNKLLATIDEYSSTLDINLITHEFNKQISEARNTGLKHIRDTDLVVFLDSDDMLAGRYNIQVRVEAFRADDQLDILNGFNVKINEDSTIRLTKVPDRVEKYINNCFNNPDSIIDNFIDYYLERQRLFLFSIGSATYKYETIKDILFNDDFRKVEDIEWTVRLFMKNPKIKLVRYPMFFRRKLSGQQSSNTPEYIEEKIIKEIGKLKKHRSTNFV